MARAWDYWPWTEQELYNPDGSMKEGFKKRLLERGKSQGEIAAMEGFQKNKVRKFDEREKWFEEKWGIPYSEWDSSLIPTRSPAKAKQEANLEKRMKKSLFAGEDISSLPGDIDPDDYYDAVY